MKTIWIFNHYATNQFIEHGGRHYSFAKYLIRAGYRVRIFCSSTIHNTDQNLITDERSFYEDKCDEIPFVFIRCRSYVGNGKSRILNMLDFYRNILRITTNYEKPDEIIGSSVHPLACVAAIKLGKRYKCRVIAEIRDLWPESIVAYGMKKKTDPVIQALYRLEKWIYTKADALIFTMEGGRDYIIEKGWDKQTHGGPVDLDKVHHINNGVDLEEFDYNRDHYTFEDPDIDNPDTFKVVYTGSIRKVNNLSILVSIAERVSNAGNQRIKFLIYGDGNELRELQEKTVSMQSIAFKGKVEKKYVPSIVSRADINYLHCGYTDIMRYGASLNKLFDYLAARRPILSDLEVPYDVILKYRCGQVITTQDTETIADELIRLSEMDKDSLLEMADHAILAAKDFDFQVLTRKLAVLLQNDFCDNNEEME